MAKRILSPNGLDLTGQKITNLGSPTLDGDATNKVYVDGLVRGFDWKQEVVAASTGNVVLTGPGLALDGINLAVGDRVLLKNQTAPVENGIYIWTGAAVALTRSLDADTGPELSGSTTTVQRGTAHADQVWRVTADDPLVIGTTAVTLALVGAGGTAKTAGNGLTETGSTYDVGPGAGILVTADAVTIDLAVVVRKFAVTIGDGVATAITVTHNLGTIDTTVAIFDSATPFAEIEADVAHPAAGNTVVITFAVAPAAGAYRVVVHG